MNAIIAIPINNSTPLEESVRHADRAKRTLESIFSQENLVTQKFYSYKKSGNMQDLILALTLLQNSDLVYFGKEWNEFKDLVALHYICEQYGVQRMEE